MTGINQAVLTNKILLVPAALTLACILVLWEIGSINVPSLLTLTVLSTVITAAIGFQTLYRRERQLSASTALVKASLQYGSIFYIGNITNILHFKIDQIMINYWLGTKAVGIYAISVNWAEMLFILDSAVIAAALYEITSSAPDHSYRLTKKLFKLQLLISSGLGLMLAVFAYPLLSVIYGEAYHDAIWPLIILIPGIVAWSAGKILSQYLSFNQGKFWIATSFAAVGIIVNVVLNLFFIRLLGINGAAIASALSYCIVILLTIVAFKRMKPA
jgi:O-antigen/teichoic acid export membrane protein